MADLIEWVKVENPKPPEHYWKLSYASGVKGVMKEAYGHALLNLWKILKEIKDEKISNEAS